MQHRFITFRIDLTTNVKSEARSRHASSLRFVMPIDSAMNLIESWVATGTLLVRPVDVLWSSFSLRFDEAFVFIAFISNLIELYEIFPRFIFIFIPRRNFTCIYIRALFRVFKLSFLLSRLNSNLTYVEVDWQLKIVNFSFIFIFIHS